MSKTIDLDKYGAVPVEEEHSFDLDKYGATPVVVEDVGGDEPSTLQSFIGGATQGATLGFGDELAGMVDQGLELGYPLIKNVASLPDKSPMTTAQDLQSQGFKTDQPTSLLDVYRQGRDQQRQNLAQQEQANPLSFMAGNVAGSIPTSIATAPMMGGPVAAGAITGGIAGLGESKDDVTKGNLVGAGKDIGTGTVLGGTLGLATKGLGAGINAVKEFEPIQNLLETFQRAKSGQNVIGNKAQEQMHGNLRNQSSELISKLDDSIQNKLSARDATISQADPKALTSVKEPAANFINELENAEKTILNETDKTNLKNFLKVIREDYGKDNFDKLNPEQSKSILDRYRQFTPLGPKGKDTNAFNKQIMQFVNDAGNATEKVAPGFQDANQKLSQAMNFKKTISGLEPFETQGASGVLDDVKSVSKKMEKLSNPEELAALEDVMQGTGIRKGDEVKSLLPAFESFDPNSANFLKNNITDTSKALRLSKSIPKGSFTGSPYKAVELAGKGIHNAKDFIKVGSDTLSKMDPTGFTNLSKSLVQKFGKDAESYSRVLEKLGTTPVGRVSNTAAVFTLMQDPNFRQMFREVTPKEGTEDGLTDSNSAK